MIDAELDLCPAYGWQTMVNFSTRVIALRNGHERRNLWFRCLGPLGVATDREHHGAALLPMLRFQSIDERGVYIELVSAQEYPHRRPLSVAASATTPKGCGSKMSPHRPTT